MIYDFPAPEVAIRQGDIFFNLPRVDISLQELLFYDTHGVRQFTWEEVLNKAEIRIVTGVRPVMGIVASQDCDAVRSVDITLVEVRPFQSVEGKCKQTKTPSSWQNIITQHGRLNQKWFYLPPDERLGFSSKMAADFRVVFQLPRIELEARRERFRRATLKPIAEAHFRERIAEFYRRYPYDEWYALEPAEMEAYRREHPDAVPFDWQKG